MSAKQDLHEIKRIIAEDPDLDQGEIIRINDKITEIQEKLEQIFTILNDVKRQA